MQHSENVDAANTIHTIDRLVDGGSDKIETDKCMNSIFRRNIIIYIFIKYLLLFSIIYSIYGHNLE